MGLQRQQAFRMCRIYIVWLVTLPEACFHTHQPCLLYPAWVTVKKHTWKKYPKKTWANYLAGSRTGLCQNQRLKHIQTLGVQILTSYVFPMSTVGLRRLICVISSTCNYVVWSLVPFGCFDAFRKASGFWRQRKTEHNSFCLELLLSLLTNTSLSTLKNLTTLIPRYIQKKSEKWFWPTSVHV